MNITKTVIVIFGAIIMQIAFMFSGFFMIILYAIGLSMLIIPIIHEDEPFVPQQQEVEEFDYSKHWKDVVPAYELEEIPKGRKYSFGVVGTQFEQDDGLTGDYIMSIMTIPEQSGKYQVFLKPLMFEGEPAIKVYGFDGAMKMWHIGWIAKEKVRSANNLIADEADYYLRITCENGKHKGFVDFIL